MYLEVGMIPSRSNHIQYDHRWIITQTSQRGLENVRTNAIVYADDLILSTKAGLQELFKISVRYLHESGLSINTVRSMTVAILNVPHEKKTVIDARTKFKCRNQDLPAL